MELKVPFYSNTPDDTHCFQAALRMVLKYFLPEKEYSWEELDQLTAKRPGLWTWQLAGMIELERMGFTIVSIELFNYNQFIKEGDDYLYKFFGEEVGRAQIRHTDIQQERELAKEFVKKISTQNRMPTIDDIRDLLTKGFLVVCNINSRELNEKTGYAGHFVVITGYADDATLRINDPGLPPLEKRLVSNDAFEKAWAYPDGNAKNIMAFRYAP